MKPGQAQTPPQAQTASDRRQELDSIFTKGAFLVLVDLALGLLAYLGAWLIRVHIALPLTSALLPQETFAAVQHPWLALAITQLLFLYIMGLYDDLRLTRRREILGYTLLACLLQIATITSFFFFTEQSYEKFPRTIILVFDFLNLAVLCAWRFYVKGRMASRKRRVVLVGSSIQATRELLSDIEQCPWMGMSIVGLVVAQMGKDEGKESEVPILGGIDEIEQVVAEHNIEDVIFASDPSWKDRLLGSLSRVQEERRLRIAILPSVYDMMIGKLRHVTIHDTPLIEVKRNPNEPLERFFKRGFDLSLALAGSLLLLPLFLFLALSIKLSSRGPIFYLQKRIGYGGKVFNLIKLRTMVENAEEQSGAVYSEMDDPRVTPVGRVLRRFRLDELPQLLNVLKGDMSFVGPRPERPLFVEGFEKSLPGYRERHKVKPGITGLAQVRSYYDTRTENKLKYDLAYIYNYGFSLDLLILLETVKVVISGRQWH